MAGEPITKEDLKRFEENFARLIEKYAHVNVKVEPADEAWIKNKENIQRSKSKGKSQT
jgi:hypothetical protein